MRLRELISLSELATGKFYASPHPVLLAEFDSALRAEPLLGQRAST